MKAILLARASTEEQDTEGQLIKLKEYADRCGFTYSKGDIFDFHESAYKPERKKFEQVIEGLKNKTNRTALCCDKIDRLVRNFLIYLPIIDELRKSGIVELHFASDNIKLDSDSPATDLFRFNMGVALAQYYSDSIRDNVKRSIYKRIKSGQILSKAPYGYKNITNDDDSKTIIPDPFESNIVLKLYELYATGAYSFRELRSKINKDFNVKLAMSTIADILDNKFYIGIATYKKEGTEYPHIYPTIVPENIYNAVQDLKLCRDLKSTTKFKYAGKIFYYRGLIKCAVCGYSLSPEEHRGKKYYCCTEYGGKHDAKYVNEDILTEEFSNVFKRISVSEETAKQIIKDLHQLNETNLAISQELINKLRRDKDVIRNRKSKLYDDYCDASITKEFYEVKHKQYETDLNKIEDKLSNVDETDKSFYITAGYIVELAKHSRELFRCSEYEERRLLIKTVLTNATWNGENLSYTYLEPFNLLAEMNESLVWGG
ncbi:MAG TPA: recombinase family protein [Thermodesulfobacteriota bacterium]|nr:recombinase family protein [Thermodesulfobacteriota bacterium]